MLAPRDYGDSESVTFSIHGLHSRREGLAWNNLKIVVCLSNSNSSVCHWCHEDRKITVYRPGSATLCVSDLSLILMISLGELIATLLRKNKTWAAYLISIELFQNLESEHLWQPFSIFNRYDFTILFIPDIQQLSRCSKFQKKKTQKQNL